MDQAKYVRAARTIHATNMPKIGAWPFLGGRRTIRSLAKAARQIETELRALEPPEPDREALEEHFILPWSEHARFLEAMADAPTPRWLGSLGAINYVFEAPGSPRHRPEDVEFCRAHGLDGCRA